MSGVYGTVRPANINIGKDVEMFYFYRPTRGSDDPNFTEFKTLSPTECLVETEGENVGKILGLYNLRLPLDKFNKKGFYTIYIRPKEDRVSITDVSVLAAYPDVKGVIFNLSKLSGLTDVTGYRLDYLDDSGNRSDVVRLITSCNRCEPVLVTIADSYPKATRYRLTDNGSNLVFCTVTPSSSPNFKPNVTPYIGEAEKEVILTNTKFNPLMVEIEMVDHDADTLTYAIEGDQVRDRDRAIITTYNDEKDIYMQQEYYTVKDRLGNPLRDVKTKRESIDGSQEYDKVVKKD